MHVLARHLGSPQSPSLPRVPTKHCLCSVCSHCSSAGQLSGRLVAPHKRPNGPCRITTQTGSTSWRRCIACQILNRLCNEVALKKPLPALPQNKHVSRIQKDQIARELLMCVWADKYRWHSVLWGVSRRSSTARKVPVIIASRTLQRELSYGAEGHKY